MTLPMHKMSLNYLLCMVNFMLCEFYLDFKNYATFITDNESNTYVKETVLHHSATSACWGLFFFLCTESLKMLRSLPILSRNTK